MTYKSSLYPPPPLFWVKALPHFASYIREARKFPSPPSIFLSYIFFFIPLKAKRLFFPSFWRWCNFTWSLFSLQCAVLTPSTFPHTLLYSSPLYIFIPPPPCPCLIGRGHFMNSPSHTFFSFIFFIFFSFLLKRFCAEETWKPTGRK